MTVVSSDATKPSRLKLYRRLLTYVKKFWFFFLLAAIGNAIYAGVDSYSINLFKPILDKGFIGEDIGFLKLLPLIVIGLFLLRGLASFIATYSMGWIGRRVVYQFRQALFDKYLKLPASYFSENTTGDLLAKLTYHVEQITEATSSALTTLVRQGCFVIGLLVVMFITSWRFTLVVFVVMPFLIILVTYVSKRFRKLAKRIQNGMGDINHIAEECILGFKEVRLFGAQVQQSKRFHQVIHYNFVQEMKMIMTNALSSPVIQLLGACVLALIVYLAVGTTAKITISAGDFVVLLSSMLAILKPAKDLSNVNSTIQRALAAAEDVFEMLDAPEEKDQGSKVFSEAAKGDIQFKNVSFGYQASQAAAILKDINLHIHAGEYVALVGRSGAGKSTLVSLLTGFYSPSQGEILLDDIATNELTLQSLRQQMAMVSQHVVLFDDTVFNNVALGQKEVNEEEIINALKAAYAWQFVGQLPQGIHTPLGENGLSLSGGQRQRIAIARAIFLKTPILILDEATSALDNESEQAIQEAINHLSDRCTRIVIAHRLSTIQNADRIIVMDQGQIIEEGTHEQLLAQNGSYASLASRLD